MWGRDDVDEHSERNNIKIYGDEANREEAQHKSFFFETNNFERFALYGGGGVASSTALVPRQLELPLQA